MSRPGLTKAPAIQGAITSRDVLAHPGLIVREFGLAALFHCCAAMVLGHRTTFLACALAAHGGWSSWFRRPNATSTRRSAKFSAVERETGRARRTPQE
jgi:hypothetical protein